MLSLVMVIVGADTTNHDDLNYNDLVSYSPALAQTGEPDISIKRRDTSLV